MGIEKPIEDIREKALAELAGASDRKDINSLSVKYLGRKGKFTELLRNISLLAPEDRSAFGKKANEVKISYMRTKARVEKLRRFFKVKSRKQVGEKTFDYTYNRECK